MLPSFSAAASAAGASATKKPRNQHGRHLERDHDADDSATGKCFQKPSRRLVQVDVEHHDDEQEQHHHRADVDQHQRDREELGAQQDPDAGGVEEREHQNRAPHRPGCAP